MTIPQIKSAAVNVALILVVIPAGYVATQSAAVHTFAEMGAVYRQGLVYGVLAAFGWIGMSSPFAAQVQAILHQEQTATTTQPSGAVTVQTLETTISTTAPPAAARPQI